MVEVAPVVEDPEVPRPARGARVLLAPNTFKGSATAAAVAGHLAAGIATTAPGAVVEVLPVADGGDGTLDAALAAGFAAVGAVAHGPTGEEVATGFALRDGVAVVEMAAACGLVLLPGGRPAPLTASSAGLGDVVCAALDAGATTLVLGIGGSASTDGGAGMLTALGARVSGPDGAPVAPGGAALAGATALDLDGMDPRLASCEVVVACDVDSPLLGPTGAAAVFGPQKGAGPDDVAVLDAALARWARLVGDALAVGTDHPDRADGPDGSDGAVRPPDHRVHPDHRVRRADPAAPGAGAAGGVGFAALAVLGARTRPGVDLVLELVGFDAALAHADLVVTGEGRLDAQTLAGKAPAGVAAAAVAAGVPVVAVCGALDLDEVAWRAAGFEAVHALTAAGEDPGPTVADPGPALRTAGALVGERLAAGTARPGGAAPREPAAGGLVPTPPVPPDPDPPGLADPRPRPDQHEEAP